MTENKLIIWDFDGVLADSEHLWVENWTDVLAQLYNIRLTPEQQNKYLEGKAETTKIELLQKDFPHFLPSAEFWQLVRTNEEKLMVSELKITTGVTQILEDKNYTQCVATGATLDKHYKKVAALNLNKYFSSANSFTAQMVERGKPAPDIFLYAARQMGFSPSNCLIVEDSIAGITAARAANIPVVAYIGATGHNSAEYARQCLAAGALATADNMKVVHQLIKQYFAA